MQRIFMLDGRQVGCEPHQAGDIVYADDCDARILIMAGFARDATAEDIAASTSPRSAEDTRAVGISTAVPGGKRPHRRK